MSPRYTERLSWDYERSKELSREDKNTFQIARFNYKVRKNGYHAAILLRYKNISVHIPGILISDIHNSELIYLQCQLKFWFCSVLFVEILVMDWTTEGSSSSHDSVKNFLHVVQTGSGVHPTSYPIGTGALSPMVKRLGRDADHSPPTIAEVKKTWICTFITPYVFMA
jgi:hypothetical protein